MYAVVPRALAAVAYGVAFGRIAGISQDTEGCGQVRCRMHSPAGGFVFDGNVCEKKGLAVRECKYPLLHVERFGVVSTSVVDQLGPVRNQCYLLVPIRCI